MLVREPGIVYAISTIIRYIQKLAKKLLDG